MRKNFFIALLVLTTMAVVFATISRDAFVYVLSYKALLVTIFLCLTLLFARITWRILLDNLKRKYEGRRSAFDRIIFESIVFFILFLEFIHCIWLRGASAPIRLFGYLSTFVFAFYFFWNFLRARNKVMMFVGGMLFLFIMLVLYAAKSITFVKDEEITHSSTIEAIRSLPYVAWVPMRNSDEMSGVTLYNKGLSFDGFNLYTSFGDNEAYLIDMHGNVTHKWSGTTVATRGLWIHAELCQDGDLLVAVRDNMLTRLDWDSKIKWSRKLRTHHDITVDENGMIYALVREDRVEGWSKIPIPIVSDSITVLSPAGQIKTKLHLYDLAKKHITLSNILQIYTSYKMVGILPVIETIQSQLTRDFCLWDDTAFDVLHTNSIEILDRDINGFCKKGDWLVSIREINLIGIIDPDTQRFVWTWGPDFLDKQHSPSLLANGNVLIFDNGPSRGFSRVIEFNPLSGEIEWQYTAEHPEEFFSPSQGFSQRLPNGNTLITESLKGRTFEVTKEGEIVWVFYAPKIDSDRQARRTIYRMTRIVNPEMTQQIQMRIGRDYN